MNLLNYKQRQWSKIGMRSYIFTLWFLFSEKFKKGPRETKTTYALT